MNARRTLFAAFLLGLPPALLWAADATQLAPGDTWTYRTVDGYNRLPRGNWTKTVTAATADGVQVELRAESGAVEKFTFSAPGQLSAGALNPRATGRLEPALQLQPFPLEAGKRWSQSVARLNPEKYEKRTVKLNGKVKGWETVKVPAGEFRALKIERVMYLGDDDAFRTQTRLTEYEWYVPELKHWAKLQSFEEYREPVRATGPYRQGERQVSELLSFRPGGR